MFSGNRLVLIQLKGPYSVGCGQVDHLAEDETIVHRLVERLAVLGQRQPIVYRLIQINTLQHGIPGLEVRVPAEVGVDPVSKGGLRSL